MASTLSISGEPGDKGLPGKNGKDGKYYIILHLNLCVWNVRRVWRYKRGNQNMYIEKEQTTQSPKEKVQKDKQRSTKHYTEN